MKLNLILAFLLVAVMATSQTRDWENPEVFAINKEKPRATFLPYPDAKLAAQDDYSASPYFMCAPCMSRAHLLQATGKFQNYK